jgi:hypothetical protein
LPTKEEYSRQEAEQPEAEFKETVLISQTLHKKRKAYHYFRHFIFWWNQDKSGIIVFRRFSELCKHTNFHLMCESNTEISYFEVTRHLNVVPLKNNLTF